MMSFTTESDLMVISASAAEGTAGSAVCQFEERPDLTDGDAAVFVAQSEAVRTKTQSTLEQVHVAVDNWLSRILNLADNGCELCVCLLAPPVECLSFTALTEKEKKKQIWFLSSTIVASQMFSEPILQTHKVWHRH